MSDTNDLRLLEDYLPIEAISAEASREKSVRKGHISTLHLWWARRPLVACRAAVYGALVPADRWVKEVKLKNPPKDPEKAERVRNGKKLGLNRKAAAEFVTRLCKYPGEPRVIAEAQKHILEAHAERLTAELCVGRDAGKLPAWVAEFKFTEKQVTYDDIVAGRAPRPRVLDMFAGGGAIPLEALRLGCEAHALDLNPVAHIIELCTLVYPQKYGKPDPAAVGMTGPKNAKGETTWGGLAEEVRYWGKWVLKKAKDEIGDLYPLIPDPIAPPEEIVGEKQQKLAFDKDRQKRLRTFRSQLIPVAYLWTRTVSCKNPTCRATVPLAKQTWLCMNKGTKTKPGRFAALRMLAAKGATRVQFQVVEAKTQKGLGFDPTAFSKAGNAICPFCGTVADADYVQSQGHSRQVGDQLMAVIAIRPDCQGKIYIGADDLPDGFISDIVDVNARIDKVCASSGLTVPNEPINAARPSPNARGMSAVTRHGMKTFGRLYNPRQMLALLTFAAAIRAASGKMDTIYPDEKCKAVTTFLAAILDRLADFDSSFCIHNYFGSSRIAHTFGRHALAMVWDYAEANPFHEGSGGWGTHAIVEALNGPDASMDSSCALCRGTATDLPYLTEFFDAIITDPPYYDNVPYADVSDFFYV